MTFWSKIFLGLTALAIAPFFYFAAGALRARQSWQTAVVAQQAQVAQANQEARLLAEGDEQANATVYSPADGPLTYDPQTKLDTKGKRGRLGIRQFQVALKDLLVTRGRVWAPCPHGAYSAMTGEVDVTIPDLLLPHNIPENNLLYVFDTRPAEDKGAYLGEFTVTKVAEKSVTLSPATKLIDSEIARLTGSRDDWVLCEVMPVDHHTVFAGLDEADVKKVLPPSSVDEYLRDGKPKAEADTDEDRIIDGNYVRYLRDYTAIFREKHAELHKLLEDIGVAEGDLAKAKAEYDTVEAGKATRDAEIKSLKEELARSQAEAALIAGHREQLDKRLEEIRTQTAQLLQRNKEMAAQWAAAQIEAARQVDERTGVAAAR